MSRQGFSKHRTLEGSVSTPGRLTAQALLNQGLRAACLEGCLRRRSCWTRRMERCCSTLGARLCDNTVEVQRQQRHQRACYRWMAAWVVGCLHSCVADRFVPHFSHLSPRLSFETAALSRRMRQAFAFRVLRPQRLNRKSWIASPPAL